MDKQYEEYGITKARQNEWRREYISFWASRLSLDDMTPLTRLEGAQAHEVLPEITNLAPLSDDYAKLWYGLNIWHIAKAEKSTIKFHPKLEHKRLTRTYLQAGRTAVELWESVLMGDIHLTEEHRAQLTKMLDGFRERYPQVVESEKAKQLPGVTSASTPEEYVTRYARNMLREAKEWCPL